jgi:hypothetical protein
MVLVHGTYRFRPKRVAFRNDYCMKCKAERIAVCVRTIDVLHIFWIPLVPLGARRRWYCIECGQPPDALKTVRQGIKLFAALSLALIALAYWVRPIDHPLNRGRTMEVWSIRVASLIGLAAILAWKPALSENAERVEHLARLASSQLPDCPVCHIPLHPGEPWKCPRCGMARA